MILPPLFLKRVERQLGEKAFSLFLSSFEKPPVEGVRLSKEPSLLKAYLDQPIPWHSQGYYLKTSALTGHHPYHHAGAFYFQEPSAMMVVPLLDIQPDDVVLDLAAAPGGKSTDIASRLGPEGLLIANDIDPKRAQSLMFNIERMGLSQVVVTQHDPAHLPKLFSRYFDKILIDAPCSGEGMFRKDPQAIASWSPEYVATCATRQESLLKAATKMLKPGGRIVYSTCTFSPEENELLIERFLKDFPEFSLIPIPLSPHFDQTSTQGIGVKIWPHLTNGEGHYAVVLQHQAPKEPSVKFHHRLRNPLPKEWRLFASTYLKNMNIQPNFILDTRLFLIPTRYQYHSALHTLRAGVFMGEITKGIFYPSHHLAHVLALKDSLHSLNYSLHDSQLLAYLRGQEIKENISDGWVLIGVNGLSLGWGKVSQGRVKNHYPKGIRLPNVPIEI